MVDVQQHESGAARPDAWRSADLMETGRVCPSSRPLFDAALATSAVVLAGNALWMSDQRWVLARRGLLVGLAAVLSVALVSLAADLRRRVNRGRSGVEAPSRRWRVTATVALAAVAFAAVTAIPVGPPVSLTLAAVGLTLVIALGAADRWVVRYRTIDDAAIDGTRSVTDVVLASALLALCIADVALHTAAAPVKLRLFALLLLFSVLLVLRSVDADAAHQRLLSAATRQAQDKARQALGARARNWSATSDEARERDWATAAIVDALDLVEGLKVADIGAGAGFFARKIAARVGSLGVVHATDIDPWAVAMMREARDRDGITQLIPVHVDESMPLPISERVDRTLIVNAGLFRAQREADGRRLLKDLSMKLVPGGRLVIYQQFVHAKGWRSDDGLPALPDDDAEVAQVIAWAEPHFTPIAQPQLPPPARALGPLERQGYLLVMRRR